MKRRLLLGTAVGAVSATAANAASLTFQLLVQPAPLTGITLGGSSSGAVSTTGAAGTDLGAVVVTGGPFTGALTLTGTNASSFTLTNGGVLPCNLQVGSTNLTNGNTYNVTLNATQGNTVILALVVTCASATLTGITLGGSSSGAVSTTGAAGTDLGAVAVTGGPFTGALTLTGTNASSFTLTNGGVLPCNLQVGSTNLTSGNTYNVTLNATQGNTVILALVVTCTAAALTGITLNGSSSTSVSYAGPSANAGQTIGAVNVTGGPFTGAVTLSGTNASSFTLDNTGHLPCNLKIGGSNISAGTYNVTLTATQGNTVTLSPTITVSVVTGMVATLTFPNPSGYWTQSGSNMTFNQVVAPGSYQFAEVAGGTGQTVTNKQNFVDPMGAFTMTRTEVTNTGIPACRVAFMRTTDGQWASVEIWLGDNVYPHIYSLGGHTLTVTGDFAGSFDNNYATYPQGGGGLWWNSRWRLTGNKANGLKLNMNNWPYAYTPYATLVNAGLIPQLDGTLTETNHTGIYAGSTNIVPSPSTNYHTPMFQDNNYLSLIWDMGKVGQIQSMFEDLTARLLCALAPTANAAEIANINNFIHDMHQQQEILASLPMFNYDVAHGCMYENIINNPGRAGPNISATYTTSVPYISLVMSGPPNTTQSWTNNGWALIADSGTDYSYAPANNYWTPVSNPSQIVFDSSGRGLLWVTGGMTRAFPRPTGTPSMIDPTDVPFPAGVSISGWGDFSTYFWSCPWYIDFSHLPEPGYVRYLLFRDPWDLFTIQQACEFNKETSGSPGWSFQQQREGCWGYRSAIFCTATATTRSPFGTTTMPDWLLPATTHENWLTNYIFPYLNAMQAGTVQIQGSTNTTTLATVFHSWAAAGGSNGQACSPSSPIGGGTNYTCPSPPNIPNNGYVYKDGPWSWNFGLQVCGLACLNRPGDTNCANLNTYSAHGCDDYYTGTNGWPGTLWTPYIVFNNFGGNPAGGDYPTPSSWAERWNQNQYFMQVVVQTNPGNTSMATPPPTLNYSDQGGNGNTDYVTGAYAGLASVVQGGATFATASRNKLIPVCRDQLGQLYSRCFKAV